MGGEELFFDAADGQNLAAQGDFAGSWSRRTAREFRERADDGRLQMVMPAGRAVLGDGAFGDVHVDIDVCGRNPWASRKCANASECSSWRLAQIPA